VNDGKFIVHCSLVQCSFVVVSSIVTHIIDA